VPVVVNRTSRNATAVVVVLNTPISRTRARIVAVEYSDETGSVVEPAVVIPPAENRAMCDS
jgi:hypothetical protein